VVRARLRPDEQCDLKWKKIKIEVVKTRRMIR
jgi:hypothetical protein